MKNDIRVLVALTYIFSASTAFGKSDGQLDGFPIDLGAGYPIRGIVAGDVDGSGSVEVVVSAGEAVAIFGADGKPWAGFPRGLRDVDAKTPLFFAAPPALCDLDGDGKLEVIVAASNGQLFAVTPSAQELSGFPVKLKGSLRGAASCLPRKGGGDDLIVATDAGALVRVGGKTGRTIVLTQIGRGSESGVAVADLDGDEKLEIIVGGGDSKLRVVDERGRPRSGFPYEMDFRISGIPAVGDVDADGMPDLLVGSQDFKIHAISAKGRALEGFPVETGYRIYAGVALGQLDDDQGLEVIVGSGDKKLYALGKGGKTVSGFPSRLGGRIETASAVADLDRDGRQEIVTLDDSGALYVHENNGKKHRLQAAGRLTAGPFVVDLDADGLPEVLVGSKRGKISALKWGRAGDVELARIAWAGAGHDARHSGRFGPNPSNFETISFANAEPRTTDRLEVSYVFSDVDWDAERDTQIRWYRDGKLVEELNNEREVPSDVTGKHQKWHYTLQAGDNFERFGENGKLSRIFKSSQVEVRNTVATAPKITLGPEAPKTTDELRVVVAEASADADGDDVLYRHVWLRDGRPVNLPTSTSVVSPKLTRKGELWRVVVVPFDGEDEGATASASLKIENTPPSAASLSLLPANPISSRAVAVQIARPATDDDGDSITYAYRYWSEGEPLFLPRSEDTLPPSVLRKHQKIRVKVTAHDDQEAGESAEVEFEVGNTIPPTPKVTIWPSEPRTRDDLHLSVLESSDDPDADPVQLRHQWYVDDEAAEHPIVVSSNSTRKGQRWRLQVWPWDGEAEGEKASVETVIRNTPPEPPEVALPKYSFFSNERIEPLIREPASDDDGDQVELRYSWARGGKTTKWSPDKAVLAPADTEKHQRWRLLITPYDGEVEGRAVKLELDIVNSAPTAPTIELSTQKPTVRDPVSVKIVEQGDDVDGDPLTHRYRWYRDGVLQKSWPKDKARLEPGEAKKGERWRVSVSAHDGEEEGPAAVAHFTVINHAPQPPAVAIEPEAPHTGDALRCVRARAGRDPDGDSMSYRTRWLLDGEVVPFSPESDTLPSSMTLEKQNWSCEVVASDGALTSSPARAQPVSVRNAPPSKARISIAPAQPATDDDLTCQLDAPSVDPDNDPIRYSFLWRVNGKKWSGQSKEDPALVPAKVTRRGQKWECLVTPSDGEAKGRRTKATATVLNSPPVPPQVRILPETPTAGQELHCKIVKPATDADADDLRYSFVWFRDGVQQSYAATSSAVPGRLVKANDLWQCRVIPNDGHLDGQPGQSDDVVIKHKKRR